MRLWIRHNISIEKQRKLTITKSPFLIPRPDAPLLIRRGGGEWGRGEADVAVRSIEDRIESLKECISVDKVEARSRGRADVVDDKVDIARSPTNQRIQRPWPDLRVGCQLE
jgi:hypothetical protein